MKNTKIISISLTDETLKKLEGKRGVISRSKYISLLIQEDE